jgi:hypothetical protein
VTVLAMLSAVVVLFLFSGIFVYTYSYVSAMRRNRKEMQEQRGERAKTEESKLLPTSTHSSSQKIQIV